MPELRLGVPGFTYADLHRPQRLGDLLRAFEEQVAREDPALWERWRPYRDARGEGFAARDASALLLAMAPRVAAFVATLFGVTEAAEAQAQAVRALDPVFRFKRDFVQRRVMKRAAEAEVASLPALRAEMDAIEHAVLEAAPAGDRELAAARTVCALLDLENAYDLVFKLRRAEAVDPAARAQAARLRAALLPAGLIALPEHTEGEAGEEHLVKSLLARAEAWAAAELRAQQGLGKSRRWASFVVPAEVDHARLVPLRRPDPDLPSLLVGPPEHQRRRDGFHLTDPRLDRRHAMGEVHYCLYCHERGKDSCSQGLREKDGRVRNNPLGIPLEGCPLDEKISEAHLLKRDGEGIAALAVVLVDNPMCPGTGHRICNDCMKACIFQKQEAVDIPQAETRILTDVVLELPWGYEIYALLTRWNPLNVGRPHALPYNGRNVMVVGSGPAGYTLAHWLMNEGFGVVMVDGLKVEPLPAALLPGEDGAPQPLPDYRVLYEDLAERVLAGFGGVAEYGITVRWDKNFLRLIHLTLARRPYFASYGGVRLGGTLTLEDIWEAGVHHVALATGAGRPTVIGMKNNLLRGLRQASDFLMALQLTGAFKRDSLANLQVRLPAIVVGGGLTAVDTATELLAYYPVQVEKVLERYEALTAREGAEAVRAPFDEEERGILDEMLAHGRAVRAERGRAAAAGEAPDFAPLVRSWGGVKIAYRKSLNDAPAYRLNHEEVVKALEEGIEFLEHLSPKEALADRFGHVEAVRFDSRQGELTLPARAVMVAAGTHPNAIYEKERPGTFVKSSDGEFFQGYREVVHPDGRVTLEHAPADDPEAFFTSYQKHGRFVTYYGDNHPVYEGNVVKAMASAKHGYRHVAALFAPELAALRPEDQPARESAWKALVARLDEDLRAAVVRVDRLTPTIVEVIVRAPAAARHFHPGQFYRLQNFEALAPRVRGTRLTMEGIALTGAWVDREQGLLSMIALEMGHSSRLCATLRPGDPVVLMGPTGMPTEIPSGQTVILAGGGLGNAVLFSIARALREAGSRVLYFAGYKQAADFYKREQIEASADVVVWSVDRGEGIPARRPQDKSFVGNILQAMEAYATGALGEVPIALSEAERIIAIGSDRMMAAVARARHAQLAQYLKPGHLGIGSINSPMQCMMKEICAQCLQRHVDPVTGAEAFVFSCFNQDQELDHVDFGHLQQRLRQNTTQEKLTNLWLDHVLESAALTRV